MPRCRWGVVLALMGLVLLAVAALPVRAASGYSADARAIAGELQSGGAFKFAEDTEDQLRSGKFELAFARYLFLKSNIQGSSLYIALNAMVDQRLHFLKAQMGLAEIPSYAAPYKKLKSRVRKEVKAVTPAEQKKGKAEAKSEVASQPGEEKPAETLIPGAPAAPTTTQPPEEETKEEKSEEKKPPPPSTWERLKRRLKFW